MANYVASNFVSPEYSSAALAMAALETKLETLDSTTQAFWLCKVIQKKKGKYVFVLLHKDT